MSDIHDFIRGEEQKMTWLDKVVMNYPKARATSFISHPLQDNALPDQTVITPSTWDRAISIVISLFLAIVWIGLLRALLEYKFPFAIFLFGFLLVTFMIYLLIRNSFFNKKYIYRLLFDKKGITIDHRRISWSDIEDTYIMNRQEGKRTNYYLLVFKKDKTIDKLDLFRMGTYDRKLATIIEYYKQKANAQHELCKKPSKKSIFLRFS